LIPDVTGAGNVGAWVQRDTIAELRVVTDKDTAIEKHVVPDLRVSGYDDPSADDRALTQGRRPRDPGSRMHDRIERNAVGGSLFNVASA